MFDINNLQVKSNINAMQLEDTINKNQRGQQSKRLGTAFIDAENKYNVNAIIWCNQSQFSFTRQIKAGIGETIPYTDNVKLSNECDLIRLVAPNHQSMFEFYHQNLFVSTNTNKQESFSKHSPEIKRGLPHIKL